MYSKHYPDQTYKYHFRIFYTCTNCLFFTFFFYGRINSRGTQSSLSLLFYLLRPSLIAGNLAINFLNINFITPAFSKAISHSFLLQCLMNSLIVTTWHQFNPISIIASFFHSSFLATVVIMFNYSRNYKNFLLHILGQFTCAEKGGLSTYRFIFVPE